MPVTINHGRRNGETIHMTVVKEIQGVTFLHHIFSASEESTQKSYGRNTSSPDFSSQTRSGASDHQPWIEKQWDYK